MALLERIDEDELEFMETLCDSVAMAETLWHDYDNLQLYSETEFGHIRLGQLSMLSYEYMVDDRNPDLSIKENFKLLEGAGTLYNFGARRFGKSLISLILDMLESMIHLDNWHTLYSSYDALHILQILERVIPAADNHPFFQLFSVKTKRSPNYVITSKNGFEIQSVNMNISSKTAGSNFFGHHTKKLWIDEYSKTTHEVEEKVIDATAEIGCVERFCIAEGSKVTMADFTTKNIEDIIKGDKIIAWNNDKRCLEETIVKNKFDSGIRDVIKLKDSKNDLWLTPEHKIRVKVKSHYGWREAKDVLEKDCQANSFSYVDNQEEYYKGILLGLLDSDGRCQVIKGATQTCYQYGLCQANEVDFFKHVLEYLNIEYSEDIDLGQRDGTFTKIDKPIHHFRIKRQHNDFIQQTYKDLDSNKDIQLGYLAGFIIGDGWLAGSAAISIGQNVKINQHKIDRIIKVCDKLNIEYTCDTNPKKEEWRISFPKYSIVLPIESDKGKRYKDILLNRELVGHKADTLSIGGYKEKVQVYDIETELHSFIVNGFIVHNSGMTDFTRHSPAGRIYDDYKRKPWVCNFPQYISPMWDDDERLKQERRYGGSKTVAYRTFVKGEVCEDGISVFDMDRVRANYNENKKIKNFEINKDNFKSYKQILVVERPKNAELCIMGADIGETAPTEIVVTFKINGKYNYTYNITLYNLTDKQQYQIFKYLLILLNVEATGIDCGDGTGRSIFRRLDEEFPSERLFFYDGSKKIAVGYKKDEEGKVTMVNGKPEVDEEFMAEWSVKHLKTVLYDQLMVIPQDFKFDTQINSVIALTLSNRTVYECVSPQNHLFDAFKVWSLTQWSISFNESNFIKRKAFSKVGC